MKTKVGFVEPMLSLAVAKLPEGYPAPGFSSHVS
jgi:hypothetical protein